MSQKASPTKYSEKVVSIIFFRGLRSLVYADWLERYFSPITRHYAPQAAEKYYAFANNESKELNDFHQIRNKQAIAYVRAKIAKDRPCPSGAIHSRADPFSYRTQ